MYATKYDSSEIRQYTHSGSRSWVKERSFKVPSSGMTECTISVHDGEITSCLNSEHKINVISRDDGRLLRSYGQHGCYESSRLHEPRICASDVSDGGSVLIAEWGSSRLQVLSAQGDCSALQLVPPAQGPCSAVVFKQCLYVASAMLDKQVISKYSST